MTSPEAVPAPAPAPWRESSSLLAPGFRFHPTDEELVIYYLKRKVSGRPLLVDAIGELDLYRCEPWDLPALSLLRSGDREWYFFTHLDRKYAGRSRTSRTTVHGYWKTTGKDRPVANRGAAVGMKKTLVFHSGRAPNGKRTNWVMHEYRLLDPLPQCMYVVCRIFEKNGAGPQNGAQYGAPFNEEEWDQDVDQDLLKMVPIGEEGEGSYEHLEDTKHDYLQITDFMENVTNPQRNTSELTIGAVKQNGVGLTDEAAISLEDFLCDQHLVNEVDGYIDMPEVHDVSPTSGVDKNDGFPSQRDGYVELNDIFYSEKLFELPNNISVEGSYNTYTDLFCADESCIVPEHSAKELFDDKVNCNHEQADLLSSGTNLMKSDNSSLDNNVNVQQNYLPEYENLLSFSDCYPYGQSTEDDLPFFDAPNNDLEQENCTQDNEFLCSGISDTPEFDVVDELMAFFDTTDENWTCVTLDSLEKFGGNDSNCLDTSNFAQAHSPKASAQVSGEGICFPSSVRLQSRADKSSDREDIASGVPDIPTDGCNKSLSKCLVDMLGSISSPPALAAEWPGKPVNQFVGYSATDSGNSIHMAAGVIDTTTSTVSKHRLSQRNGSMEETKMNGGILRLAFWGWSYVLFISTLLIASYRVCMCFSSR